MFSISELIQIGMIGFFAADVVVIIMCSLREHISKANRRKNK